MWFRDGKVLRVKEYLDTQSAVEFFGWSLPSGGLSPALAAFER